MCYHYAVLIFFFRLFLYGPPGLERSVLLTLLTDLIFTFFVQPGIQLINYTLYFLIKFLHKTIVLVEYSNFIHIDLVYETLATERLQKFILLEGLAVDLFQIFWKQCEVNKLS